MDPNGARVCPSSTIVLVTANIEVIVLVTANVEVLYLNRCSSQNTLFPCLVEHLTTNSPKLPPQ